jgi:beta-hydroxylase
LEPCVVSRTLTIGDYALSRLGKPQVIAAAVFAASSALLHYRGKARLAWRRQAGDHSTLTAPYNLLVYAASKAPSGAYLPVERFPELTPLLERWRDIRDEALALRRAGGIAAARGASDIGFHTFFKRGWTRFYLRWYGTTQPSARKACPVTCEILDAVPSVKGAMFAVLPAGARLGRHRDPFAGSLRLHIGLATPNDDACWIEVDGERYAWRDGEAVVFDETYVHEAANETGEARIILLADVERPLAWPMRPINRAVMATVMRATASPNAEGEPAGAINRAFEPIHGVLQWGKPLKASNRRAYYAIKNVIAAVLFGAFAASILF